MSGSCEQNLAGIYNSVSDWWLFMGWIPSQGRLCMVLPSNSALNFVSVTPFMGIKNNEFMKFLGKWMYLEDIILSEVTQSQKNSHDMHSLISGY